MNLKEEIYKLIKMQEIDSELHTLVYQKDIVKPAVIDKLKNSFENKKNTLSIFENKVRQLQLKHKNKELDLSSQEDKVKKLQSQLYQLKTNKEYKAKMMEIESSRSDVSLTEEYIINLLDELDKANADLERTKSEISVEEKIFRDREYEISKDIKQLESEVATLHNKCHIISIDVDKKILLVYEHLIKNCSGKAISAIEHYNCNACFINVTAQKVNRIKMYKDLVYCDNCARILYIKDDFQ